MTTIIAYTAVIVGAATIAIVLVKWFDKMEK
jgi:hypothetical protein